MEIDNELENKTKEQKTPFKKLGTERQTAEERRVSILAAAITEFANYGLHGASTENVAKRAGVSQPYIFRLFGTKKDLFIAACEVVTGRIITIFRTAAEANPANSLEAMGMAYAQLLRQREELLLLLHSYAACADKDIQQVVRQDFGRVYQYVATASGAGEVEMQRFMAQGMLSTIITALDLAALQNQEQWAAALLKTDL
jgi:AcrR family transcriptional regulator